MLLWFVPGGSERIRTAALVPDSVKLLDIHRCGFDEHIVNNQMNYLGEEGRRQYIRFSTWEDFFYPVSYGVFLCMTLFLLAAYCLPRHPFMKAIAAIPLLTISADYVENYHLVTLLRHFPDIQLSTIEIASVANCIKWSTAYFSLILVLVFGMIAIRKMIFRLV